MESIEAKDIILLVIGWAIAKILDALFDKAKEKIQKRNTKKPAPQRKKDKEASARMKRRSGKK